MVVYNYIQTVENAPKCPVSYVHHIYVQNMLITIPDFNDWFSPEIITFADW